MDWAESDMFEPTDHENKPFSIRIPSLLVSRGADGQINFLTAMWYAPAGFNPSRMMESTCSGRVPCRRKRSLTASSTPPGKESVALCSQGHMTGAGN